MRLLRPAKSGTRSTTPKYDFIIFIRDTFLLIFAEHNGGMLKQNENIMADTPSSSSTDLKNPVETPYITMWMEGDILCATYKDNLHIDLDIARQVVDDRLTYSQDKSFYCYVDMRGIRSITREARQHLAERGSDQVTAGALLVESILNKTLGNIFLLVDKPRVPIRMFTKKAEAIDWLKQKQREAQQ